ncbi:MAG: ribonuclease E/G, partial [Myxococcota bacterium]
TEALVAVDVNSGKSTKEDDHEATVYKTNLEAARELARQLRLRDLGGIIVVDFIDMQSRRHDRDVERVLKEAMRDDKAKVKIGRISENGTLELTRQRLRQAHRLVSFTPCAHCRGTGVVRDPAGLAVAALRQLHTHIAKRAQLSRVICRLPVEVANVLNNRKRRELLDLSQDHDLEIEVWGDDRLNGDEVRFEDEKRGRAGIEAAQSIRDPRLDGDRRGRRGRRGRGRQEEAAPTGPTLPAPSIGPVPVFLETEEAIAQLDAQGDEAPEAAEWETEEGAAPAPSNAPRPRAGTEVQTGPVHYDDPLLEALFGDAPEMALQDAEAPAPAQAASGEEPRKKRRRSRRRRGRKRQEEGAESAAAAEAAAENDDALDADGDGEDFDEQEELALDAPEVPHAERNGTATSPAVVTPEEPVRREPINAAFERAMEAGSRGDEGPGLHAAGGEAVAVVAEPAPEVAETAEALDTAPTAGDEDIATTGTGDKPRRTSARRPRGRRSAATANGGAEAAEGIVDDGAKPRRKRRTRTAAAEVSADGAPPPSADA